MAFSGVVVEITKFINPHLFWIFEKDKTSSRLSLEQELAKISPATIISNPIVGQEVLVKDQKWKRAVIKAITHSGIVLWLTDYGIVHKAQSVYNLPDRFVNSLPLIKRAALKDVVCIQQNLLGTSIELEETVKFNPGTIKCFQDHTSTAVSIFFHTSYEKYGSHVGEMFVIGPNGNLFDLGAVLVANKILALNADLFDTALQENIKMENLFESFKVTPAVKVSPNKPRNFDELSKCGLGRGVSRSRKTQEDTTILGGKVDSAAKLEYLKNWTAEQARLKATCDDELDNDTSKEDSNNLNESNFSDLTSDSASQIENSLENLPIVSRISNSKLDKSKLLQKFTYGRRQMNTNNLSSDVSPNCSTSEVSSTYDSTPIFDRSSKFSPNTTNEFENSPVLNKDIKPTCKPEPVNYKDFSNEINSAESSELLNLMPAGHSVVSKKKVEKQPSRYVAKRVPVNKTKSNSCSSSSSRQANSSSRQANSFSPSVESHSIQNPPVIQNQPARNIMCIVGCKCENCKGWVNTPLYYQNDQPFIGNEEKTKKVYTKPPLLLKTDSDTVEAVIEMKTFSSIVRNKSKVEIASTPKILVHGRYFPPPVTLVSSTPFHPLIHKTLKSYKQPFTIQSYVWPALMRRLDVCLVNQQKSGKTTSYLPSICSFLLEKDERYALLPKNVLGPIVIVLCPGIRVAEDVYNLTSQIFSLAYDKPVYALAVPPLDKQRLSQFQKQCDMLITTPNTLICLLRSKIICVKRLCHLVIENCDTVLYKFSAEVDSLLNLTNGMLDNRGCNYNVQMILTAEHWTLPLEGLLKKLKSTPIVYIGTYLEAALYGRVDIEMHFIESNLKKSKIVDVLKETSNICRAIILCNGDQEIDEIKEYLQVNGVDSIFIYDKMEIHEILELESGWLNTVGGKHLVLVCSDQVLNYTLNINNAVVLIHYSLPNTWTLFANRFNCLLENYRSPLVAKKADDVRSKVHVFFDETNDRQFLRLAQFLSRMGSKLTNKFREYYKVVVQTKENNNVASKVKLCNNLKLFGQCDLNAQNLYKTKSNDNISCAPVICKRRHLLTPDLDYSSSLPKSGQIKFKIICVQNVTCFTVKILEHTDTKGNKRVMKSFEKDDLQSTMKKERNVVYNVEVGNWYIFYSLDEETYYRCAVEKVLKTEMITKKATLVSIRLLDSGTLLKVSVADLYEIPIKFHKIPPEGVDVYLANLVPPDHDDCWSAYAKTKVETLLQNAEYTNDNVYGTGQILLQLQKNVWLKNVLLFEKLSMSDLTVIRLNLRKTLEDNNLANYCEDQLNGLYKLCSNSGINLPDYNLTSSVEEGIKKSEEQIKPQWAHIDGDSDCTAIYINCFDTPSLFHVRLQKHYKLFLALQKDIQIAIAKPFYPQEFEIELNKLYLAKDTQGEEYCRVQVVEIKENLVKCFYVDYGDSEYINKWELKYLSNELIFKLPFQAIECRLYGVAPVDEEWDDLAIDIFKGFIYEPNTNNEYFRTLYSASCLKEKADTTGGDKFAIILADNFSKKVIVINQLLIICGAAIELENEKLSSEFCIPEQDVEDVDFDEVEEFEDITIEQIKNIKKENNSFDSSQQNNSIQAYNNDDENSDLNTWDIEIEDAELFLKQLSGISVQPRTSNDTNQELPHMKAAQSTSGHYTPNVVWYQTQTHIKINILLPSEDYKINVIRQRLFSFIGSYDKRDYLLNLQLFNKVEKTVQHSCGGSCIKVTLTKCKTGDWSRLVFSTEKMIHITYDVSQCVIDDENKKKEFLHLGDELDEKINDGIEYVSGSDDSSESDPDSESFE